MINLSEPQSVHWLMDANNSLVKTYGCFSTKSGSGKSYEIEWEKVESNSDKLNEKIKSLSFLLVNAYSQTELGFAKKFPDLVKQEMFLKSLAPLFENDSVDWNSAENQIKEVLNYFFINIPIGINKFLNVIHNNIIFFAQSISEGFYG